MPQYVSQDRIVIKGIEFVRIPKGTFIMGSNDDWAPDYEKPQHTVEISYDYWIARYEVTNDQFAAFVKATKYQTHAEKAQKNYYLRHNHPFTWRHPLGPLSDIKDKGDHPVVCISWHDALEYIEWLNTLELGNKVVHLPTEAEWEKSARGEYGNIWPWGNKFDYNKCNCNPEGVIHGITTTSVSAYSPQGDSPYGVADMVGNVWEWTRTKFKLYPYGDDGREDLSGTDTRVVRGESYQNTSRRMRCAVRGDIYPTDYLGSQDLGFRCVAYAL